MVERTRLFAQQVESLRFSCDCYIYNPLLYAWPMHEAYLRAYLSQPVKTLLLGMNPGPFGMAQTGVPFGEVGAVKHFLDLQAPVGKPVAEHPRRPVLGLDTKRSEVSGKRLWSLIEGRYHSAQAFSKEMAVTNYCPLVFMDRGRTAKNITPDKLPKGERLALETICDRYLADVIEMLGPIYLVGVGQYAYKKLQAVSGENPRLIVGSILHPSPGNPQANKDWHTKARLGLEQLGVW
ncbi:uracil-DNA glycosylase family protein [Sphaerochaeta sp.]|uniref:uracil-DNA glycosylase family protein n=1 Tax=Sphaerochaeta sp. TaxID=1972642 RepID=UPI002FC68CD8